MYEIRNVAVNLVYSENINFRVLKGGLLKDLFYSNRKLSFVFEDNTVEA